MVLVQTEQVPLRIDDSGSVRIGNTRVLLDLVIGAYNSGSSPEEIVDSYTTLELADVYSVIGYYLRHKTEIDAYLAQRDAEAEEIRKKIEARFDPSGIRERLLMRRAQKNRRE